MAFTRLLNPSGPSLSSEPPRPESASQRMGWIDSLRGISATLVMLHHFLVVGGARGVLSRLYEAVDPYIDLGLVGVATFFLISGFVVPRSALQVTRRPLASFAILRIFRLFPAYWLAVVLAFLILRPPLGLAVINLSMLQRFVGHEDVIGVFWTLQVELIFYVVVAVLLGLGRLGTPPTAICLALAFGLLSLLLAAGRYFLLRKLPLAPGLGLTMIWFGQVLYWRFRARALSDRSFWLTLAAVVPCIVCACLWGYSRDWGFQETPARFILSYALAFLLFCFGLASGFKSRFLLILGRLSYSLYLFHSLVEGLLYAHIRSLSNDDVALGACVVASYATAYLVFYLVEEPLLAVGKRVAAHYSAA